MALADAIVGDEVEADGAGVAACEDSLTGITVVLEVVAADAVSATEERCAETLIVTLCAFFPVLP